MARRLPVDLYCEDSGHELFVEALVDRLATEEGVAIDLKPRNARGGHGKAVTELKAWQKAVSGFEMTRRPDLLIVVIDGNCKGWTEAAKELEQAVDSSLFPAYVIGCPDPHVERWCMADPESFKKVVGGSPPPDPGKCVRDLYKKLLRESILANEHPILTNEMEFAPDLVRAMDLYRASKNQRSLKMFVDKMRMELRSLKRSYQQED